MGTTNPVRIRLRYPDLDSFVQKFAPNVTRGGVFLASRNVHPVNSLIDFEIQLVNGTVALAGRGKVTWVKEFSPAEPNRPYGMGVQFLDVAAESRPVLARILRHKAAVGPTGPRLPTGVHATLGTGTGIPSGMGDGASGPNGKSGPAIDTSVDLAAELGVDEAALRVALDRRRTLGARVDDDLSDLLRRDPPEPVTLAQALGDLPRLLDPQSSRRRSAGGFSAPTALASREPAAAGGAAVDPAETTAVVEDPAPAEDDGRAIPVVVSAERSSRSGRRRPRP